MLRRALEAQRVLRQEVRLPACQFLQARAPSAARLEDTRDEWCRLHGLLAEASSENPPQTDAGATTRGGAAEAGGIF